MDQIISQNTGYRISKKRICEMKNNIKKGGTTSENTILNKIRKNMFKDQIRENGIFQWPACNNCSNVISTEEFNYNLNKQQFLDAVRLWYRQPKSKFTNTLFWWKKFDTQHAVQGKKGEFETLRHKKLRGITGAFCEEVCHDVVIELILQSVTDCSLIPLTTNTNDGSRSYVKAKSFWITG